MFDRYDAGEQAVLVHIYFSQDKDMEDLQEFETLASSAGVEAMQVITGSRKAPHPKYFVGEGKAVEIAEAVKATGASVVLFDHALSPAQERNLERLCECRVIDRTGLILDIFAQRARTHEGKLQVELAQLRHMATRLVRGWTHLERQKGGIGLRGPGETQLETDRRLLRNRIMQILTIVTTIFLPLTLLVGWYGMNFAGMPELTWKYGYPVIVVVSIVIVGISLWVCKRKKFW